MSVLCSLFFLLALLWFNPSLFRPEYAIVMIGILVGTVSSRSFPVRMFRRELGLLVALAVAGVATVASQVLSGDAFIWRDLMVTLMLGYYAGVFIFVSMASGKTITYKGAWIFGLILSVVITAISIFQYFNLLNVNSFILPSSGSAELLREGVFWKRTVGTIGNPNYWGFIISVALALLTYMVFWRGRMFYLPLFLGLLVSLILTGSRSALICWLSGTMIGGVVVAFIAKEVPRVGIAVAAALVLVTGVFGLELTDYYENKERFSVTNVDTLVGRMTVWEQAWLTTTQDFRTFLLGQGPRKGVDTLHWGDNSYIKIFRDYGVVSLGLYLSLLWVMVKRTLRHVRTQNGDGKAWAIVLFFVLIQWCTFELSADTWFFVRVSAPVLAIYAFIVAKMENSESTLKSTMGNRLILGSEVLGTR